MGRKIKAEMDRLHRIDNERTVAIPLDEAPIHPELTDYANEYAKEQSEARSDSFDPSRGVYIPGSRTREAPISEVGKKRLRNIAGLDQPIRRTPTSSFVAMDRAYASIVQKQKSLPLLDAFKRTALFLDDALTSQKFDAWADAHDWYPVFTIEPLANVA